MIRIGLTAFLAMMVAMGPARALERPDKTFKIYQFPANMIPRIDGKTDDWADVGADYVIGSDMLSLDNGSGTHPDPANLKVSVRVAWVKGLNRLYFLYEATDNYWDFSDPGLTGDIFELAVDGDRSGGPFIARFHPEIAPKSGAGGKTASNQPPAPGHGYLPAHDAWFGFQNVHAQNYHIFTPARDKDWAMAWGPQAAWIKRLPYSNIASSYDLRQGQAGKLTMEFWITPFDFASAEGPQKSVESELTENKIIAMAWAIIDSDGPTNRQFWNLSPRHTMYGQASELCAFRLMPLEARYLQAIDANWSFRIADQDRRIVAFKDESVGKVTAWRWDFGDGQTSSEQHPIHTYAESGQFVVTLNITGPGGTSRFSKVWDVSFEDTSK